MTYYPIGMMDNNYKQVKAIDPTEVELVTVMNIKYVSEIRLINQGQETNMSLIKCEMGNYTWYPGQTRKSKHPLSSQRKM